MEFRECNACVVKPGMPILCDSCLHNRQLISDLPMQIAARVWCEPALANTPMNIEAAMRIAAIIQEQLEKGKK
jgi:hypothetical protein